MLRKSVDKKTYTFIPHDDWINNVNKTQDDTTEVESKIVPNNSITNDVFESYDAKLTVEGKFLICNDSSKLRAFCKKTEPETYEQYLELINKYDQNRDTWIYNIVDGTAEQEKVLYRDDLIVIIPDYKWNEKDINKLHILVLPTDKSLRSIRSLNASHIELLNHCKTKTCEIIKNIYDIDSTSLKMYFHYVPSTWHLHIHFVNIANTESNSSVEYSHELSSVIFNLGICPDYYQRVTLNRRL